MKKILLLAVFLGIAALLQPLYAQSSTTDELAMRAFAREFMAAYNRQDVPALQSMYTTNAVSKNADRSTQGADNIAQEYENRFIRDHATLLVRHHRIVSPDAQQTLITVGTYESYGATVVYDIPFHVMTAYRNTMVMEDGRWKIAQSVVTELVQTFIYQKTGDLSAWKSALTEALQGKEVLGVDIGASPDNAKAVYALIEWSSIETAKAFFKTPAWQKVIRQIGKAEKPTVYYLDKKK